MAETGQKPAHREMTDMGGKQTLRDRDCVYLCSVSLRRKDRASAFHAKEFHIPSNLGHDGDLPRQRINAGQCIAVIEKVAFANGDENRAFIFQR